MFEQRHHLNKAFHNRIGFLRYLQLSFYSSRLSKYATLWVISRPFCTSSTSLFYLNTSHDVQKACHNVVGHSKRWGLKRFFVHGLGLKSEEPQKYGFLWGCSTSLNCQNLLLISSSIKFEWWTSSTWYLYIERSLQSLCWMNYSCKAFYPWSASLLLLSQCLLLYGVGV